VTTRFTIIDVENMHQVKYQPIF